MSIAIDIALAKVAAAVAEARTPVVDLIAVQTDDPYKVLVATILSARTKDEVTARVAARLFREAADLPGLARLSVPQLAKLLYPVGFFNNKAKYLAALPAAVEALFDGRIPETVEELVKLPGVGRKTANLVVAVAFKKPAICVDTHVHRIMNIWGYVETKTPLQTEMALRKKLPRRHWLTVNSLLVRFGQALCRPLAPHCDRCPLLAICPQRGVTPRKRAPQREASTTRCVSWNVNGLRAVAKKGFADSIAALNADIIALQEIKAMAEQLPDDIRHLDGYQAWWQPAVRKGYAGVCTYSRLEPEAVHYGLGIEEFDHEGRVLTLEFADFVLINTYFPNAQHGLARMDFKLAFNHALLAFANGFRGRKMVLVCGDFNVAHRAIDLANPRSNEKNPGFTPQERAWMDSFLAAGYQDTFRMFNQQPGHYSWWSYRFNARARNIGWRIDYFCVDEQNAGRIKNATIHPEIMGSDHCPVGVELVAG